MIGKRFVLCPLTSTRVCDLHHRSGNRDGTRTARTIVACDLYK